MWGVGGRFYWGRKGGSDKTDGIVVVFAWMSSQERHLKNYVDLYSSLGWDSLVCHSQFLNMFFPEKATTLAFAILSELIKELKIRPSPVVFASFSGGPKACMCQALQIIEGKYEAQLSLDDSRLIKDCIAGYIYDSSPVDFTSDMGTRFVLHPSIIRVSHPPRLASWLANGISSGLDALFLNRFESQRAEYWQILYSTVTMRAPYLLLCSENDDLAPYQVICNFAQRLQDLGGDVKIVKWNGSPHVGLLLNLLAYVLCQICIMFKKKVEGTYFSFCCIHILFTRFNVVTGHYRHYPLDYKASVSELLAKATLIYSQRTQQLKGDRIGLEGMHGEISEPICELRKAAVSSNQSLYGLALEPSDQFFLPNSMEYCESKDIGSIQDKHKEGLIHLPSPPSVNAHGVLGQILFDVCVPNNVEGWDIRPSSSSNGRPFGSTRRHAAFNPIKCMRRSRL